MKSRFALAAFAAGMLVTVCGTAFGTVYNPGLWGGEKNAEPKLWNGPLIAGSTINAALYSEAGTSFNNGSWTYSGEIYIDRAGVVTFGASFWDGASMSFDGTNASLGGGSLTFATFEVSEPGWYPITVNLWRTNGRGGTTWSSSTTGADSNGYKDYPEAEGFRYVVADAALKVGDYAAYAFPYDDGSATLLRTKKEGVSYFSVGEVKAAGSDVTIALQFGGLPSAAQVELYYDTADRGDNPAGWRRHTTLGTGQQNGSATLTASCVSGGGETVARLKVSPMAAGTDLASMWVEWSEPFSFELEATSRPVCYHRVLECALTTATVETEVESFGSGATGGTLYAAVAGATSAFGDYVALPNSPTAGRLVVTNVLTNLGFGPMRCLLRFVNDADTPAECTDACVFTGPDEPMALPADGLVQFEIAGNHYNDSPLSTNLASDVRVTPGAMMTRIGSKGFPSETWIDPRDGRTFSWTKTYVYRGSMYLFGGVTYRFGEAAYDYARLDINGDTIYNNNNAQAASYGTFTPKKTGLYSFDYRQTHTGGGSGCMGDPYAAVGAAFWTDRDYETLVDYQVASWHGYFNAPTDPSVFSAFFDVMRVNTFQRLTATRCGVGLSASTGGDYALYAEFAEDYPGDDASKWSSPVKVADVPQGDGTIWEFDVPAAARYVRFRYVYADAREAVTETVWIPGYDLVDTSLPAGSFEALPLNGITATGGVASVSLTSLGGDTCTLSLLVSAGKPGDDWFEVPLGTIASVGSHNIAFGGLAPHRTYAVKLVMAGSAGETVVAESVLTMTTHDGDASTVVEPVSSRPLVDYRSLSVTNLVSGDNVWLNGRILEGCLAEGVTLHAVSYSTGSLSVRPEETVSVAADGMFNVRLAGAKPGESCRYELVAEKDGVFDRLDPVGFTPMGRATDGGSQITVSQRTVTYSMNITPGCNETMVKIDLSLDGGATFATAVTTNLPVGAASGRYYFKIPVPEFGMNVKCIGYVDNQPTIPANHAWGWDGTQSGVVKVEDRATYVWKESVSDGAWEDAGNWTADLDDNAGYPHYSAAVASFAARPAGSVTRIVSSAPAAIGKLDLGSGRTVTLAGEGTCLRTGAIAADGSVLGFEVPKNGYAEVPLARRSTADAPFAPSGLSVVVDRRSPMFWARSLPNGAMRRVTVLEGAADVTNLLSKPQPRRSCTTAVPLDGNASLAFDILSCLGGFAVIVH